MLHRDGSTSLTPTGILVTANLQVNLVLFGMIVLIAHAAGVSNDQTTLLVRSNCRLSYDCVATFLSLLLD